MKVQGIRFQIYIFTVSMRQCNTMDVLFFFTLVCQKIVDVVNNCNIWYMQLSRVFYFYRRGRRGRDYMVAGFATTCAISAYHH